jgi:putative transposase
MKAQDVTATLDLALAASGLASDLADWLDKQNIEHVRGAPYHPQT